MRIVNQVLAGVLAAVLLSGCAHRSERHHPAARPSATPSQPAGAIADLSGVRCRPADNGVWRASGTLTNQTSESRAYDVTFAVIKPKTSEVLGKVEKRFVVKPGASEKIKVRLIHRGDAKRGKCVSTVTIG